ncbi:ubiquinone biosynthesis O-methyltransferase [Microstroma glucosiphilum]|uniref:Ubiquinone biosynthesis O-methyltransferase, mitochondrial n=1 Tax=Pseudomicrostroma glucosiphilum TaxID=1684307 RepID=A0A316U3U9_9BASI|nr:ubiquinone biosynthesis O-methyltransferase [Pseudomicrostroma glucosiphilum]PWN19972.1 ubiquinone biosynthesis O-methyltransferase [Pseudomicrostroma glucosiphilum]
MIKSAAASTSRLKLPSTAASSLSQYGSAHRPRSAPIACSSSSPLHSTRNLASSSATLQQHQQQQQQRSSVHASEVEHFTRLSSTWWDPNGELSLLHKMNKGRIAFLRDKVVETQGWDRARETGRSLQKREWCKGLRVLDVGCGGGLLSESLARLGATVHGIDATGTNIAIAQHHASLDPFFSTPSPSSSPTSSSPRLTYSHTAAEDLLASPSGDHAEGYDIVASVEVLEHVSSPAAFLHSLSSLLKPGGHLLLSTIARTPLARLLTITLAEEVMGLVSRGTHSYEKYVKSEELRKFIAEEEGGGLGWYPSSKQGGKQPSSSVDNSNDAFASLDGVRSLPSRLQMESRGIIYDPLIGDWRLLDRSGWMQRSGWGEECNYLLWARKPIR